MNDTDAEPSSNPQLGGSRAVQSPPELGDLGGQDLYHSQTNLVLLNLAGFYRPPYRLETEVSMEIEAEDEGEIIRGRMEVLGILKRIGIETTK